MEQNFVQFILIIITKTDPCMKMYKKSLSKIHASTLEKPNNFFMSLHWKIFETCGNEL